MTVTPSQQRALRRGPATFEGFVGRDGSRIVDGSGTPLLLRGVGLGNWLLPEGYMWGFGAGAESPRQIEAAVRRVVGEEDAARFWQAFREQFITERDIAEIAAAGFDHVRLPINARVIQDASGRPIEEGYRLIDRLIAWCRRHGLWVVLDLHGAPGGQTGTNIDDSGNGKPELFMDPGYRRLTIDLWRELARRYRAETAVLAYDLLNEPLPNEWQHTFSDDLVRLYRELTEAIRQIDADHLLMYEGSHWATNWSIFTEVWDERSVLQFHKYWSPPDSASLAPFLEARDRLQLPIYMGEGGEHNLEWLYAAFRLYESHGIGWNLWTWKKVATRTSPASIVPPAGWELFVAAVEGRAEIGRAEAQETLRELLAGMDIDRCDRHQDVVAAVLAERPATIPAWGGSSALPGDSPAVAAAARVPAFRIGDGLDIRFAHDVEHPPNPFEYRAGEPFAPHELLVVHLEAGAWLAFDAGPDADPADYLALGADGSPAPARIERAGGLLRVTAEQPSALARLVRVGAQHAPAAMAVVTKSPR